MLLEYTISAVRRIREIILEYTKNVDDKYRILDGMFDTELRQVKYLLIRGSLLEAIILWN